MRVDSTDRVLTTNQGVPIAENQSSSRRASAPTAQDFILREKITHFDHERSPSESSIARGSAAHGVFECTKAIPFTRAALFGEVASRRRLRPLFDVLVNAAQPIPQGRPWLCA